MRSIIIIPARYASTRFPGKPLARIGGIPMIVRVAQRVTECADVVLVATDDRRIYDTCEQAGIRVVMTDSGHRSGTDRIYEAYTKISAECGEFDIVVNVQGDEPFINPQHVRELISSFSDRTVDIATLCTPFPADRKYEELADPNRVKVVCGVDNMALYFSRSVIPYLRGIPQNVWPQRHTFLTHIGVYAYRSDVLARITRMPQSPLELCESLEQLRWLENGLKIKVNRVNSQSVGIDTPEDLEAAEALLAETDTIQ
ncbi:MAG: 3-deoxy-manno-octulosonate cytidylyltransferase [Muribaculaceae bacterium]|nr:3-deoxy-manno-octulosonate cytidylyltransferase [Muribaculaceae bacterium]